MRGFDFQNEGENAVPFTKRTFRVRSPSLCRTNISGADGKKKGKEEPQLQMR
jgi:hypothetical protein